MVKEDQICSVNRESEVDVMKQLLKTESEIMLEFQRRRYAEALCELIVTDDGLPNISVCMVLETNQLGSIFLFPD